MPRLVIILIVLAVIIVIQAIRMALRSSSHHFDCPECGASFHVSFFKYMFTAHSLNGECSVTCPKCGKHNMLAPLKGKV